VAGAVAFAVAGGLALVPFSVATATPVDPVVSYATAGHPCDVTLPGGARAQVTRRDGGSSAQLVDPSAARSGMFSFDDGGHDVLLPATDLSAVTHGTVDVSAFDTALLAQRQCGWPASKPGHGTGGYQLGRLTVHTIGLDGQPMAGFVLLTNVDNQNLARPILDTTDGLTRMAVPDGHYSALLVDGQGNDYRFVLDSEFTVTDGTSITLDERTATVAASAPTTPKPADLESSSFGISRGDSTNVADWFDFFNLDPTPASFLINPVAKPKHGVQVINPAFELTSPATAASPYQYHITEPTDHVSGAFPTKVDAAHLATVTRHYDTAQADGPVLSVNIGEPRAEADAGKFGLRGFTEITPGTSRTEYFSASPDIVWLSIVDADAVSSDEVFTSPIVYQAGRHTTETFHQGAEHPGPELDLGPVAVTCAACSAEDSLQFNLFPYNDNTPGHYALQDGLFQPGESESASFQLRRDGTLVASDDTGPQFVGIQVPGGTARYALTENVGRSIGTLPLSVASQTTWSFTANPGHGTPIPRGWTCPAGGTNCGTLPFLYAYYTADTTPTDGLTAGRHTLDLDVQRQQGAPNIPVTGADVSVSYDDGATWVPAGVRGHAGQYTASFTVPAAAVGGYVSVRVAAWDAAGNRIDQTVQRAYAAQ
jgi:hypothetical protein